MVSPQKKATLLGSFANLDTLKTSKMSHFPINGTSAFVKYTGGTQGRSLRPGTIFMGMQQALSQSHSFVNI